MPRPTVFIGYSHQDEQEKEVVLAHLNVLRHAGLLDVWHEDRISAGADWEHEIEQTIEQANVAILLISANFLTSEFMLERVVPRLLKRQLAGGLIILPIIIKACAWQKVSWLPSPWIRPKNGQTVWGQGGRRADEELAAIAVEVAALAEESTQKIVDIPVVVAAMTRPEADDLVTGRVFDNPEVAPIEYLRFQEFQATLAEYGFDDLAGCYHDSRDAWRPPSYREQSVKHIIRQMAERINHQDLATLNQLKIRPRFISADFFAADPEIRSRVWQTHEWGSIIVADSVSLFHPWVHKILSNSEMSSREDVAVLILSPINFGEMVVNQLIEQKIMERALTRFTGHLDKLCEFGTGDLRALQRWLFMVLPELANQIHKMQPYPANREIMRKVVGKKALGMEPFIY